VRESATESRAAGPAEMMGRRRRTGDGALSISRDKRLLLGISCLTAADKRFAPLH